MTVVDLSSTDLSSWRLRPAVQLPDWHDHADMGDVLAELAACPPLVFADECRRLRSRLAEVAMGHGFVLQGGDCAERFDQVTTDHIGGQLRTILQMSLVLSYATSAPTVNIGRIAGQYAKPRSRATETRGPVTLPAYRGDAVNVREFDSIGRQPDPRRLLRAYNASATTLNLLRGMIVSPETDAFRMHEANRRFVERTGKHRGLFAELDAALNFMRVNGESVPRSAEFHTSHEALLLRYETALTRLDPDTGEYYGASGHMVWIGERTRQIDGAHVEFASKIANPIGVKLGPTTTPADALALIDRLDPNRIPGRLTFITRMGAGRVRDVLPTIVEGVKASGARVVWLCDPMHGNTFTSACGYKSRHLDDILGEITGFLDVHRAAGTHAGGIHLELTGDNVTECVAGPEDLARIGDRYESACDPRLNREQSIDLAFRVAELLGGGPAADTPVMPIDPFVAGVV